MDTPMAKTVQSTDAYNNKIGNLPLWNLSDLYPGMKSEQLKKDQKIAATNATKFRMEHKTKIATSP